MAGLLLVAGCLVAPGRPATATPSLEAVGLGQGAVTRLALAAHGGVIAVANARPDDQGGGLTYLACPARCTSREAWSRATLLDHGYVQQITLAFDPWGRPHAAFRHGRALVYATCTQECGRASSWSTAELARVSPNERDYGHSAMSGLSLALDEWGRPRIAYVDEDGAGDTRGPFLAFASCDGGCTDRQRWTTVPLATPRSEFPAQPRLAYTGTRPRLVYTGQAGPARGVFYAECDLHCLGSGQWQHARLPVPSPPLRANYALRLDGDRPRVAIPAGDRAGYLACDAACATEANWPPAVVVDRGSFAGNVDLALRRGRPQVVYADLWGGWLQGATCEVGCTGSQGWGPTPFHAFTGPPVLAADGDRLRLAYVDDTEGTGSGPLVVAMCDSACGAAAPISPPRGATAPSTSSFPPPTVPADGASGDRPGGAGPAPVGGDAPSSLLLSGSGESDDLPEDRIVHRRAAGAAGMPAPAGVGEDDPFGDVPGGAAPPSPPAASDDPARSGVSFLVALAGIVIAAAGVRFYLGARQASVGTLRPPPRG